MDADAEPGAPAAAQTLTRRLAEFLLARPGVWIDGRILARVGGAYGWRTRVSDARRRYGLTIENRVRRVRTKDGHACVASEYRLVDEGPR